MFEEIVSPITGVSADANRSNRHVVTLTAVEPGTDPVTNADYVAVSWDEADALPFDLCVSAITLRSDRSGDSPCPYQTVSVARGNVFLLDHGLTRYWPVTSQPDAEWLGAVPIAHDFEPARCEAQGQPKTPPENAGRFNPALRFGPLTYRAPWPVPSPDADPATCSWLPASTLLAQDPTRGRPMLSLKSLAGEAFAPCR